MPQHDQTQMLTWVDIKLAKRLKRRLITEGMSYRARGATLPVLIAASQSAFRRAPSGARDRTEGWLGDLDSNQDCTVQSREFYR